MRLFNGADTLEFERSESVLRVLLTGAQIRMGAIDVVRHHVTVAQEAPDDFEAVLEYSVSPAVQTLRQASADARTRTARLRLAQRLAALIPLAGTYTVPFLHPENIELTGAGVSVIHSGLVDVLAPMTFDESLFLRGYRALVLSIVHPRHAFEKLADGAVALDDPFSRRVVACDSPQEVASFIDGELAAESARAARERVSVPKRRYRLTLAVAAVAAVAAAVCGWLAYSSNVVTAPRQEAVITAQAHFLTDDYAQTLATLRAYSPSDLPKSARYVLAVSSVKLTDLTGTQKDAVLDTISPKTDDNTLDYWIFLARGDLDRALNLAQNLGDDQLSLLAYTNLYQATKLNTTMDGARKQKLLTDYSKQIEELTARLGAAQ
ncbi:type VII secretion protein EssB [Leifsonia xyli]|uniref:type VII secretion protein EssB n=1 Tax=Leifsonia xyli TaxID=1575 RepID=UPI003D678842